MSDLIPTWVWPTVAILLLFLNKRASKAKQTGRVVGIVGKMGSGKSYFATRMAYDRMKRGANIYTNFSMHLEPKHDQPCPERCVRRKRCRCARHCPCQMASRWHRFEGWEQFVDIFDAVVIVDEADLYAPSHDPHCIPDYVRHKLKMCRKHKIDLFWIAQGEDRVNRLLRQTLTNEVRLCQAWFSGMWFSARTYEPGQVGRRKKHTSRSGYMFRKHIAGLYDTMETIRGDEERGDGTMAKANALTDAVEAARSTAHASAEQRRQAILTRRRSMGACVALRADGKRYCTNKVVPEREWVSGDPRCRKHTDELEAERSAPEVLAEMAECLDSADRHLEVAAGRAPADPADELAAVAAAADAAALAAYHERHAAAGRQEVTA